MNLQAYVSYPERRLALEAIIGAAIEKTGGRFLRRRVPPALGDLAALTDGIYGNPTEMLASAPWGKRRFAEGDLRLFRAEYTALQAELKCRYDTRRLAFPTVWAVETGTSFLLYALVRGLRPSVVIELGVGNGQSSFYMLRALKMNGAGRLHSFDIATEAGGLLSKGERAQWDFRLIDRCRPAQSLVGYLATLPKADLCFHDADHGYLAQHFDFAQLWDCLKPTGLLVSDDVDTSHALIDFCALDGKRPDILLDRRKAVGVLHRTARP